MGRDTEALLRQCAESKLTWDTKYITDVSIKSLLSGLKEDFRRGGRKSVKAREDGRNQGTRPPKYSKTDKCMNSGTVAACK